jgi:hypothetical protein
LSLKFFYLHLLLWVLILFSATGCTNQTLDCFAGLGALIGGLTAAVIAAIIVAALIACAALAGGGAYAVTTQMNSDHNAEVMNNPLFTGSGAECHNVLHDGGM